MTSKSTEENTNNDLQKHKNITCLIHYNENDDQTKIFEVLKKFRIEKGLKFSHHKEYIFFTLSSEFLGDFYKERPFKISRFQSKSSYKCTKESCDKLMGQKDSFIRMIWDEDTNVLTFMSRTLPRIHGILVRRIFTDSKEEFIKDSYSINRDENYSEHKHSENHNSAFSNNGDYNLNNKKYENNEKDENFIKIVPKVKKTTETKNKIIKVDDSKKKTILNKDKPKNFVKNK